MTHVIQITTSNNVIKSFNVDMVKLNSGYTVRCGAIAAKDTNDKKALKQCAEKLAYANNLKVKEIKFFAKR